MKFVLLLIVGLCVYAKGNEDDFRKIDAVTNETPCLTTGGICTIAADCPAGRLTKEKGLCPKQRSQGIECCYGVSVKETRCRNNGGECWSADTFCNPDLIFQRATDCPKNYKCCILV